MKRTVFGVVVPLGWLALAVVPFALAWHRLPEPIACHWSLLGPPDGAAPRQTVLTLHVAAAVLAWLVAWIATRPGTRIRAVGAACGLATFIGVLFGLIAVVEVIANLDAPTWHDAGPLRLGIALVLGGASAAAAIASRAARSLEVAAPAPATPPASVGLGATERAIWFGYARNRVFGAIALACFGAAVVAWPLAPAFVALALAATSLLFALFTELHARVDERGLSVAFGPLHFPRMRWTLDRIRSARARDIVPMKSGGWGYRGSLALFGRAALIIRGGGGLELTLDGDQVLLVTIDDAATAAGLLNDLVARRG
jgi:hypothetical protein